jgi:hypothetical protein
MNMREMPKGYNCCLYLNVRLKTQKKINMKKHIYLFSIIFALSVFSSVTAKADTTSNSSSNSGGLVGDILGILGLGGSTTPTTPAPPCGTTALPIDSNIVLLTMAGVAVGVVSIKKAKQASPSVVN